MPNPHGSHIWYELLTSDPDAAAVFYGTVVGWTVGDSGQGGMDYRIFSFGDAAIGGLMKLPQPAVEKGMRPGWLGYVGVDDVDVSVARLTAAGGGVHMPAMDLEGVGRMAMVSDPQGAAFYLMRGFSAGESSAFKPMADGHCSWNELATSDPAAALAFYGELFGWEKGDVMPMGDMGDYQFITHNGQTIGAVMGRMEGGPPPSWNYYFRVPDIDAAIEKIGAGGGSIAHGPAEIPGGEYIVIGNDPQNAIFSLVGPRK